MRPLPNRRQKPPCLVAPRDQTAPSSARPSGSICATSGATPRDVNPVPKWTFCAPGGGLGLDTPALKRLNHRADSDGPIRAIITLGNFVVGGLPEGFPPLLTPHNQSATTP